LPGSKNTMEDLKWMCQNGLEAAVKKLSGQVPIFGICGGFQMLGCTISDPHHTESGGSMRGMELLPVETVLKPEKTRRQAAGKLNEVSGIFAGISKAEYVGYEIHMGETNAEQALMPVVVQAIEKDIYGTYIHGIFDQAEIASKIISALAKKKGIELEKGSLMNYAQFKETQYDKLADTLREYLNMEEIYGMLREADLE
ncbi:MAG: cobyric acid synthase CobQ, partial [Lachnospiraceae bacterium]|nr:cobyric acid synthase CobQ [Lachnospiraceae bacterium]